MIGKLLAAVCMVALLAGAAVPASAAASPATQFAACSGGVGAFLGLRAWDSCLIHDSKGVPQITDLNDIWKIVLVLVEDVMKVAGYAAVGFIVWGGIKYTKSQGDPGEITQARQIIHNALFGLVIVVISIAIVTFVTGAFN